MGSRPASLVGWNEWGQKQRSGVPLSLERKRTRPPAKSVSRDNGDPLAPPHPRRPHRNRRACCCRHHRIRARSAAVRCRSVPRLRPRLPRLRPQPLPRRRRAACTTQALLLHWLLAHQPTRRDPKHLDRQARRLIAQWIRLPGRCQRPSRPGADPRGQTEQIPCRSRTRGRRRRHRRSPARGISSRHNPLSRPGRWRAPAPRTGRLSTGVDRGCRPIRLPPWCLRQRSASPRWPWPRRQSHHHQHNSGHSRPRRRRSSASHRLLGLSGRLPTRARLRSTAASTQP